MHKRVSLTLSMMCSVGLVAAAAPAVAHTVAPTDHAQAALTASAAEQLSQHVDDRVIVVMRNQLDYLPDSRPDISRRAAAARATQASVVAELTQTHAKSVHQLSIVNAVTATVSAGEAKRLAHDPAVAKVVRDEPIPIVSSQPDAGSQAAPDADPTGATPLPGACASGNKVQLDPQAIETIHAASQNGTGANAQALGYTGSGVKVGFIADGLDIDNPDFIRANGSKVFVDYQDFSGSGTSSPTDGGEAFLDASSIAAQGRKTYDVSTYGDGLNRTCNIRVLGVAPGSSLVGLDVFGDLDNAYNSVFLRAINYAVNTDHVNVLNESFGSNPFPDTASLDLTKEADNAAVRAGVTVTVSSGDAGISNTIGSPATDPQVISAGASTTYRSYAQTGIGGITYPGVKGWLNNNISGLSSGGFDQQAGTVDIVAPGDLNWALCTPKPAIYAACTDFSGRPSSVELEGGTSEAAPLTAGVAALVIQAYRKAHGGATPSPALVKKFIVSTAQDINAPADQQGAGLIDAYAAVRAAASSKARPVGSALLKSSTQLTAVAARSTRETLHDTLTNTGAGTRRVELRTRSLGAYSTIRSGSFELSDRTGNYAVRKFTVKHGQARLNAALAFKAASGSSSDLNARVRLALIDPEHRLAEYNLSQGAGNFTLAQVANPRAGRWTAFAYGLPSSLGGTTGKVRFTFQQATWRSFGTVSPAAVTLKPYTSKRVTLYVSTPSTPGDAAGSIQVVGKGQPRTSIPVTLRSLIPQPKPTTSFTGVLTGGNGREESTGQTNYYQMYVSKYAPELNVQVTVRHAKDTFLAELVDPQGVAESTAGNAVLSQSASKGATARDTIGTSLHVLSPQAGRWTLILDFFNQTSGSAVAQPFHVRVDEMRAAVRSHGVPDDAATAVRRGSTRIARVTIKNTSDAPEQYFLDPRRSYDRQLTLAAQTTAHTRVPVTGTVPSFLVPTHARSITATTVATRPSYFDFSYAFGDPDLFSSPRGGAKTSTGTYSSAHISQGNWQITPFQKGPDGAKGSPKATATESMRATAAAFATSVRSPTGDLWLQSVSRGARFTPYLLAPGQSVTIPVSIKATGPIHHVVSGTIYVDEYAALKGISNDDDYFPNSYVISNASDVAAIPFSYRVGR